MTTSSPVYNRAPSEEIKKLLLPDGFLSPLVGLAGQKIAGHYHDVHFRVNDEVHVYRGHTRLVNASWVSSNEVRTTAHSSYLIQPCAQGFFRLWPVGELGFKDALDRYLNNVPVRPDLVRGEAAIQEQWSQVNYPWVPFDREGVLGGPHAMGRDLPQVQTTLAQLDDLARSNDWDTPETKGNVIDRLAVDERGRLVILELKDGSKSNSDVYYSPFQLLQYVWEWYSALETVRSGLQAVIDARKEVGLTSSDVPTLTGGIRAAIGFGFDTPRSDTKLRYEKVLEVVNRHLPDGVCQVETWAFNDSGPYQVS